jgi:hypothetical protein
VLQILMEADVEGLIGAGGHERSAEGSIYRNGYRDRNARDTAPGVDLTYKRVLRSLDLNRKRPCAQSPLEFPDSPTLVMSVMIPAARRALGNSGYLVVAGATKRKWLSLLKRRSTRLNWR